MSQEIIFNEEAKKKLQAGVNKLSEAVKTSLGPSGMTIDHLKELYTI